jgi:two-component system response regulator AlgR
MTESDLITVFIVDDESLARERLKRLVERNQGYQVCGEAENGAQALTLIEREKPDIVLLDIRMPGIDGLEVASALAKHTHPPAVIFCTAYDEYAIDAFKKQAMGYLLKPVRGEELNSALSQARHVNQLQLKALQEQEDSDDIQFVAHSWKGQELIAFDSIYYFKSEQKYITVIHKGGETISDQTLKELENEYPEKLLRAHRNSLVNVKHISAMNKDSDGHYYLHIRDSEHRILVSRRHVSELKQIINDRSFRA